MLDFLREVTSIALGKRVSVANEVDGQPLVAKGIQPPPPEPDGHVSVHPALQTQDLLCVAARPGKPGPPAGGRRILSSWALLPVAIPWLSIWFVTFFLEM